MRSRKEISAYYSLKRLLTIVDNNAPYVQAQAILTVKVWRAINLSGASKSALNTDQFLVVPLERNKQYKATRDGREYGKKNNMRCSLKPAVHSLSGPLSCVPKCRWTTPEYKAF